MKSAYLYSVGLVFITWLVTFYFGYLRECFFYLRLHLLKFGLAFHIFSYQGLGRWGRWLGVPRDFSPQILQVLFAINKSALKLEKLHFCVHMMQFRFWMQRIFCRR